MLTRALLQKPTQSLLDLLLPPRCIICKTADSWFCPDCLQQVALIIPPVCRRCGTPSTGTTLDCRQCQHNPLSHLDGIRAASYFEDNPIRPAIHFLKYRNHKAVAAILAGLLAGAYRRFQLAADMIVPVPLHSTRLRERGYNQSELLARQVSSLINLPVNPTVLQRTRYTKSQMTLGFDERHRNVAGAFACVPSTLTNQRILLIDDVCTTGSTLDACARVLKAGGAASVWGLTLAKAR